MHLAHHHLYNWNIFHLHYSELALLQIVLLIIAHTLLLTTIDFCSYQVKKTITRKTKFDAAEACKNHVWFHCMKCCFSSVSFTVVVRQGKWGLLYIVFNIGKSVFYKLLLNILHGLFLDIVSETYTDTHRNFSPTFWGKTHI